MPAKINEIPEDEKRQMEAWPYNLLEALEVEPEDPLDFLGDVGELEVAMCMGRLTQKEKEIIRLRFFKGYSLREVAKSYSVGAERIRQIEAKGLRKLRHFGWPILKYGVKGYINMRVNAEIEKIRRQMEVDYQNRLEAAKLQDIQMDEDSKAMASILGKDIQYLDLSVRAYNCLTRARVETVADILKLYPTYSKALTIRNLGRKSLEEISNKLGQYEILWPKEDDD